MIRSAKALRAEPASTPHAQSTPERAGRAWLSSLLRRTGAAPKARAVERGPQPKTGRRVGILVVHGIGEQTRFEQLEAVASNCYLALEFAGKNPRLDVLHGDQVPLHSPRHSWRETPIVLHWTAGDGEPMEAWFREVHWADLDLPDSIGNWFRFVLWAVGMPGIRLYTKSRQGLASMPGMTPPTHALNRKQQLRVRSQLLLLSLQFFLMLISLDLLHFLLERLSMRWGPLETARQVLYAYLGDIKLYQDRNRRFDMVEVLGRKSRVVIRQRMVRGLVRMASEVDAGRLDGYYVVAHSLGTVVAWNGLMVPEALLANYLSREEWRALPSRLKKTGAATAHDCCEPARPPWLEPTDAVDRRALLSGLRGFLTLGSPLDKFAALWPAIVPVNEEPLVQEVPWVNVHDAQDIVAGSIDSYSASPEEPVAHSFRLQNISWGDQKTLLTAHTSYWRASPRNRKRTIDRLIGWIETGSFEAPANTISPALAKMIYADTLMIMGLLPVALVGTLIWTLGCVGDADLVAQGLSMLPGGDPGGACPIDGGILRPPGSYWNALLRYAFWILGIGVLAVGVMSAVNRLRENVAKPKAPRD